MYPYASVEDRWPQRIEPYSARYYAVCALGGILACVGPLLFSLLPPLLLADLLQGPTHTAVTPLDLVKCRRQVSPHLYASNMSGWRTIARTEGLRGIFTGWAPTLLGYSAQGALKYGGYEFFKKSYSDLTGTSGAPVYLAAAASAEFVADVALCPFEAVKVRVQTAVPPVSARTVLSAGVASLYQGLYPLWARQIPCELALPPFPPFCTLLTGTQTR